MDASSSEKRAALLRRTPLFGSLDDRALSELAGMAYTRSYEKGQPIFYQGDAGDSLFVIEEGMVKLVVSSETGDEMVVATLASGEIFGELSMIDGGPRAAGATAARDVKLLGLRHPDLARFASSHPGFSEALLKLLGNRLRRTTEYAFDLVFLDLPGRVAKLLFELADTRGAQTPDGIVLDLGLTQGDLAAMVGGSRPSVNQILRSFESRGYLSIQGSSLVVSRPDLLRRRAQP